MPIQGAAWSKTWVCGRSPAEILDSNPTGMCVCCESVFSGRGFCDGLITRPEESYRLSLCVRSRNFVNGEWPWPTGAGGPGGGAGGLLPQIKKKKECNYLNKWRMTTTHKKRTSLYGAGKRFHDEAMRDTNIRAGLVLYVSVLHGWRVLASSHVAIYGQRASLKWKLTEQKCSILASLVTRYYYGCEVYSAKTEWL